MTAAVYEEDEGDTGLWLQTCKGNVSTEEKVRLTGSAWHYSCNTTEKITIFICIVDDISLYSIRAPVIRTLSYSSPPSSASLSLSLSESRYKVQYTRYFIVLLCIQLYTYKTSYAKSIIININIITEVTEVDLGAFVYGPFLKDFSSLVQPSEISKRLLSLFNINQLIMTWCLHMNTLWYKLKILQI